MKISSVYEKTSDDINKNQFESSSGNAKNTINEMVSEEDNEEVFNQFIMNNKEDEESEDYERDINSIHSNDINLIKSNEDMPFFNLKLNFDNDKFNNIIRSIEYEVDPNALQTLVTEYKNSTTRKKCFNKTIRDEEINRENLQITVQPNQLNKPKNDGLKRTITVNTDKKNGNVNNINSPNNNAKTIKLIKPNRPSPDPKNYSHKKSNKTVSKTYVKSLGDLTKFQKEKDIKNTSYSASKVITCESSMSGTTKFNNSSKEKILRNSELVLNSAFNIIKAEQSLKRHSQINKKTKK